MKLIKQWFAGLVFAIFGGLICLMGVEAVLNFIAMMNSSGTDSALFFLYFLLELFLFLFLPCLLVCVIKICIEKSFK